MTLDRVAEKLRSLERDPGVVVEGPRAAVAAILREHPRDRTLEVLFIRRAEHPKDPWSGHVAFPGGRRDPEDTSLLATAIRETREEVGIVLEEVACLGRLPDVPAFSRSKKGNLVVTPFVFALRGDALIIPNVEVATTLWAPLAPLIAGTGRTSFTMTYEGKEYDLPCVFLAGEHRLWGMTYRMVETLLDALA